MRVFISDIKRGLKMWQFWFCVIVFIGIGIYNHKYSFMMAEQAHFYEVYGFLGALNRFINSFFNSVKYIGEGLLLISILIFSTATCNEIKTGFWANRCTRIGYKKLIANRVLSTFTLGIMAYFFALGITLLGCFIIDPKAAPPINDVSGPIGVFYDKGIWYYVLMNILNESFFIGGYTLFSMGITLIWRNQYIGFVIPLLYYYFRWQALSIVFSRGFFDDKLFLISGYSFNYQHEMWHTFLAAFFVYCIAGALIYIGFKRWRNGVW